VFNQAVTVSPCAVAHGSLSVTINTTPSVSQPGFGATSGTTQVTQKSDITISQQGGVIMTVPASADLGEVVKALNALGATPMDLLQILQAMKSAGALNADLVVES
jgi:flagellar P-ring protein precursor FlgI